MAADFLSLPDVPDKPREVGLTHVLDKGVSVEAMRGILTSYSSLIDIWKFGWGTSYAEPRLAEKIELLRSSGVHACIGGTLLEVAWAQDKAGECLAWARDEGFDVVEVSRGSVTMPVEAKWDLIDTAARDFIVVAETGYKSAERLLLPEEWHSEMVADLASGATYIVAEGRESGTVGVYDPQGQTQEEIVDAAIDAAGVERAIFEAPRKDQQTWFITRCGPTVNLGNISVFEVLPLYTLRRGLRADTAHLSLPSRARS